MPVPGGGQNHNSSGSLDRNVKKRMSGTNNTLPGQTGKGDIIWHRPRPENEVFLKAPLDEVACLPHESVGGGAPPLFPSLPLLPWPRLVEVGGSTSTDTVEPDVASAGGPCCDGRDWRCSDPRWRTVGEDKRLRSCSRSTPRPRVTPIPPTVPPALPLRARATILRRILFLSPSPSPSPSLSPFRLRVPAPA